MEFDWNDIALAGALAEEMMEEEKESMRLEQEIEPKDPPCEDEDPPDNTDIENLIP